MSWLKRRDAEQQSAVIRNLSEHNKQLWEMVTAANNNIAWLTVENERLRAELRQRGVVA